MSFGFNPSRASPPPKKNLLSEQTQSDLSQSISGIPPELVDLSPEDVELIEAILERAGPDALAFFSIFKAYNDVMKERGLLHSSETYYYGKILKLGTWQTKAKLWADKWNVVKAFNGYDAPTTRLAPARTKAPVVAKPIPARRPQAAPSRPSSTMAPSSLTDDLFSSVSYTENSDVAASQTSFETETEVAAPAASYPFLRQQQSSELTNNTLGLELQDSPLLSVPSQSRYRAGQQWEGSSRGTLTSTPLTSRQYQSSISTEVSHRPVQNRPRAGSVLNEDDAWSKVKAIQDEKKADRFRQDRLLDQSWGVWKDMYKWVIETNRKIDVERDVFVVRLHLYRWRQRAAALREWYNRVAAVEDTRRLKIALGIWKRRMQDQLLEKKRKEWRQDMRMRLAIHKKNRKEAVLNEFLRRWRRACQLRFAERRYLGQLTIRYHLKWKETLKYHHDLGEHADHVHSNAILIRAWEHWRHMAEVKGPEEAVKQLVAVRVKREVFSVWRKQWEDIQLAKLFYHLKLVQRAFKSWKSAQSRVKTLQRRSHKHLVRQDNILLRAVMRVWKARERGKLLEKVKAYRLLRDGWSLWKARLEAQHRAEATAIRFSQRLNSATNRLVLQRWRDVHATHINSHVFATRFYQTQLVHRVILKWKSGVSKQLKLEREAERYRLQHFWINLRKRYHEKIRMARLHAYEGEKVKAYFKVRFLYYNRHGTTCLASLSAWLNRAKTQRHMREAEDIIQDHIRKRLLHDALQKWTIRVVEIKDRELKIAQGYRQGYKLALLTGAFSRWKNAHRRIQERLRLLQSHLDVKREDMLKRILSHWHSAAQARRERRLMIQEKEEERRLRMLTAAWSKWRERYVEVRLQPLEYQIVLANAHLIKFQAFAEWKKKTKSLPAIKLHASHLKARCFKVWLNQLPRALQARTAREVDRQSTLKCFFNKWVQVHRTKLSLKAVARARYFRVIDEKPAPETRPAIYSRPMPLPTTKTSFPRRAIREDSPTDETESEAGASQPSRRQPRPLSARTGLLYPPSRTRTEPSPTRTLLSTARTREPSPARSTKSVASTPAPWYARDILESKFPPAPSSMSGTEGRSSLWQELRGVQSRSQSPSSYSRRSKRL